jgi:ABC transport system ATP-binding/permease protein
VDVRPTEILPAPTRTLRIGRAGDNDFVVADLSVSRHHAELRNVGGRYQIVDLGSHNGTFLNGSRIAHHAPVTEQDIIGIGRATFRLVGDELREFIDEGDVSLIAQDLTVRVGGQVLIDQVSFLVGERSLVAVIGPSGSGKTTLLNALTGLRPATEGTVLYDNRDLYSNYAELRRRIGLVPQEDVIYPDLTPRRFLGYAAELRFPGDTSPDERNHRVQEVIDELKLMQTTPDQPEPPAARRSGALSGGQKKRVSIGLELLTKPSVLFLDEPTSSLDVELKEDVVDSMKELAKTGRTVIMVTHDLEYLDKCDRVLVLMPGGRMALYGPSDEGLRYFGKARWAEVYRAFRDEPERDWAGEFKRSRCYQQYVARGLTGRAPQSVRAAAEPPRAPRSRLAQLVILSRRYVTLIAANRGFLCLLVGVPIALGGLIRAFGGWPGLAWARQRRRGGDAAVSRHHGRPHRRVQLRAGADQGTGHLPPGADRWPVRPALGPEAIHLAVRYRHAGCAGSDIHAHRLVEADRGQPSRPRPLAGQAPRQRYPSAVPPRSPGSGDLTCCTAAGGWLVRAPSSASRSGASAAPIRWYISSACRSRSPAWVAWPLAMAHRPRPASAFASSQELAMARASSRACR